MRKVGSLVLFLTWLLGSFFLREVKADIGPKPSVRITFQGMGKEPCYGTLLANEKSTGPFTAWNGVGEYPEGKNRKVEKEIWEKFLEYQDGDGFYFLQNDFICHETGKLEWTYYPPSTFKILLYYPEKDRFYVSKVYERYAFDSYFTVDMKEVFESKEAFPAKKAYFYEGELESLFLRIFLTIGIEILIALFFGFRGKKLILFIAGVNVVTQIFLNVSLNLLYNSFFRIGLLFLFSALEVMVFMIEARFYEKYFKKFSAVEISRNKIMLYALFANAISFGVGLAIARTMPGMID